MKHFQAQLEDSRLEVERRRTFRGSARISLDVLHFEQYKHRNLDAKHVEYLKGCFRRDRCRRLEVRNHIEAEIDQQSLDVALRDSHVTASELLTNQPKGYPRLVFPQGFELECLHGQHRIQAAREFLLPSDKWWTVDLYTSDINDDLKTCLNEQHSNEDRPTDGEAYCKIRFYHFQRDTKAEMRWKACLRGCRLKNLKELLEDEELTAAFDALLDIPGVWDGMRLTTLQKMMAMGCKDECLNYLRRIKEVFSRLVGKDGLGKIDTGTVKALERRAPGASTYDFDELRGGKIFSAFSDRERDMIWEKLKMVDGLVPSLFTFFRDIQYLKLCIDCLKRLVVVPKRTSVCETLARNYSGKNQREGYVKIQVTEDSFQEQAETPDDGIDLRIRQLIALAMRHYPDMPAEPVREDPVQKATKKADPAVLRNLADLAYELGFDTPQIRSLRQYPGSRTKRYDGSSPPPLLVTSGPGVAMSHRSGIPRKGAYKEDWDSLFINHLHNEQQHQGEGITSFFVRKSVYLAFFGRLTSTNGGTNGSVRGSSPDESNFPERPTRAGTQGNHGSTEDIDDILSSYAQHGNDRAQNSADMSTEEQEREERERQEREGLGREREAREREAREREAREREEQERAERERMEERERLDRKRRAQVEAERKRQELERLERERLERERLERERLERERLERERLERERLSQERLEEDRRRLAEQRREEERRRIEEQRLEERKIVINFFIRERGSWRSLPPIELNPEDPSEIERVAKKYMWKNIRTFNTRLELLTPQECFQAILDDRTQTILLVPQDNLSIDEEMVESARKFHAEARRRVLGLKRVATDDISQIYHGRKFQALNPTKR